MGTGSAGGVGLAPAAGVVPGLHHLGERIDRYASALGRGVTLDPLGVAAARAGGAGLVGGGRVSWGGGSRLLPSADGWLAATLARPSDWELAAAWLERDVPVLPGDWATVAAAVAGRSGHELAGRAAILGMAASVPGERRDRCPPAPGAAWDVPGVRSTAIAAGEPATTLTGVTVVDLTALWAGPLVGAVLRRAGARVVKVESPSRPDGARRGPPAFFRWLNAGKEDVTLDFDSGSGQQALHSLLARADVVLTSCRHRALDQLGLDPVASVRDGPTRAWVHISGYGGGTGDRDRAAFGDDAAVAGGLVVDDGHGPCFFGDAVADPATGLAAVGVRARRPRARRPVGHRGVHGRRGRRVGRAVISGRRVTGLLIRSLESEGGTFDLRCTDGRIAEIGHGLDPRAGESVLDGARTALPGLHDHHLHLAAMAAAAASIWVGTDAVASVAELGRTISRAATGIGGVGWLRAVGYDDATGHLDRWVLDAATAGRPARVQHRAGHLWVLNSAACAAVGLDGATHIGIERDGQGTATGRLFDMDDWLSARLAPADPPELAPVSRRLASYGVTGVTDATPACRMDQLELLARARETGAVTQRVVVTGGVELAAVEVPHGLDRGPIKVVISDHDVPSIDGLAADIRTAHRAGRPVAVHSVTRTSAVLAVAAWEAAGAVPGDRMEHGGVLPPDAVAHLSVLGITVVTQPSFIAARGDRYLRDVEPGDLPHLYRCASLERAGVAVGGSTDAPFGPEDPWAAMAAAVDRRSRAGIVVGDGERVTPERALGLFLSDPAAPGGRPRCIGPGRAADLCLLDCGREQALDELDAGHVVATVTGGRAAYQR